MVGPYDKTTHDGRVVDEITHQALVAAEKKLGYELTLAQGSYNQGGVKASGGTHDGGGVVDLAPFDHARKVRVLRDLGFAAWYRPAIAGLWGAHVHAVLIGNQKLSAAAQGQVIDYRNGRDGLAGDRVDPNPYRPSPAVVFKFVEDKPTRGPKVDATIKRLRVRKAKINQRLKSLLGIKPW
jgi:hypothetical protein